jgi:hypothetical protein
MSENNRGSRQWRVLIYFHARVKKFESDCAQMRVESAGRWRYKQEEEILLFGGTKAEITSCYSGDLHSDLGDFHQWTNKVHKTEMTWIFFLIQRKSTMAHMYTHELREHRASQRSESTLETHVV